MPGCVYTQSLQSTESKSELRFDLIMTSSMLTRVHCPVYLHQALEGEVGDVGRAPAARFNIIGLLKAHPSAHLLPIALLHRLIHFHICLTTDNNKLLLFCYYHM